MAYKINFKVTGDKPPFTATLHEDNIENPVVLSKTVTSSGILQSFVDANNYIISPLKEYCIKVVDSIGSSENVCVEYDLIDMTVIPNFSFVNVKYSTINEKISNNKLYKIPKLINVELSANISNGYRFTHWFVSPSNNFTGDIYTNPINFKMGSTPFNITPMRETMPDLPSISFISEESYYVKTGNCYDIQFETAIDGVRGLPSGLSVVTRINFVDNSYVEYSTDDDHSEFSIMNVFEDKKFLQPTSIQISQLIGVNAKDYIFDNSILNLLDDPYDLGYESTHTEVKILKSVENKFIKMSEGKYELRFELDYYNVEFVDHLNIVIYFINTHNSSHNESFYLSEFTKDGSKVFSKILDYEYDHIESLGVLGEVNVRLDSGDLKTCESTYEFETSDKYYQCSLHNFL